jgi:hypothetical protein
VGPGHRLPVSRHWFQAGQPDPRILLSDTIAQISEV